MYMFLSCAGMTGLWGLVNNAGILYLLPIEWTPMDIFKHTADVNLWGMIDVTKTFVPLVKKAQGRVVNFSSVAGKGYESISGFPWDYQVIPNQTSSKLCYRASGKKEFRHFLTP